MKSQRSFESFSIFMTQLTKKYSYITIIGSDKLLKYLEQIEGYKIARDTDDFLRECELGELRS